MAKTSRKQVNSGDRSNPSVRKKPKGLTSPNSLLSQLITYQAVKRGISASAVKKLIDEHRLRRSDVQMVIPARTLERRLSQNQTLKIDEADAIARLVRVRDHALRAFEREDVAEEWLTLPNPALAGEVPIKMARTDVGAREVEAVLTRFEHGVYG